MSKLRVWWNPQVGCSELFYMPVESPEEAKKFLDTLAAYDAFQLQNNIKGDYCNTGGLQEFNEGTKEWEDWFFETEDDYFDDVDIYCDSSACDKREELEKFSREVLKRKR